MYNTTSRSSLFLIVFIMFIGLGLRLYNLKDIPLSNDELSALNRTQFESYTELIEKGIKVDGHPAGVQTFLYIWTNIVGEEAWIVRLPFLIMGILSIWMIFNVGKELFSEECGLFAAASVAMLQYFIVQTTYARPYASGLCFILFMTWFGIKLIDRNKSFSWIYGITFVLFFTLSLYNHYFSSLIAGIIGLTILIFIPHASASKYYLLLLAVFILYIPHLPILFTQLSLKGLGGWLAPPTISFPVTYLAYIFHFSIWIIVPVAILGILSFIYVWKRATAYKVIYGIMWIWWAMPLIIGWVYSVWVDPVLHYNVLFFSVPFLLIALFSGIPRLNPLHKILGVSTWCIIVISTLVWEREHFHHFYQGGTHELVKHALEMEKLANPQSASHYILVNHPFYADYYAKRYKPSLNYASYSILPINTLRQQLTDNTEDVLTFGWHSIYAPLEIIGIIREFFPTLFFQKGYFVSEFYAFHRSAENEGKSMLLFQEIQDFENYYSESWSGATSLLLESDSSNHVYTILSKDEYSAGFTLKAASKLQLSDIILSSVDVKEIDLTSEALLVLQIYRNGESLYWKSSKLRDYVDPSKKWSRIHVAMRIWEEEFLCNECEIRTFIWNPTGEVITLDNFEINVLKGNPNIYSLIAPIDRLSTLPIK